jgi:hypothetical protein
MILRIAVLLVLLVSTSAMAGEQPPDYVTTVKIGDIPESWVINGKLWKAMTMKEKLSCVLGVLKGRESV